MEFKDYEAWLQWLLCIAINSRSERGKATFEYVERWVAEMEKYPYEPLENFAKEASYKVARGRGGSVSGFMHSCARGLLITCWKRGEELAAVYGE